MPTDIAEDSTSFPTPLSVPAAGEPRTATGILGPFQYTSKRTAYLKAQLERVLRAADTGVYRIRHYATQSALKASTDLTDGAVAIVDKVGLYQYDATTSAGNTIVSLRPDAIFAGEPGRWVLMGFGAIGAAYGLAQLNEFSKLDADQMPYVSSTIDTSNRIQPGWLKSGPVDFKHASAVSSTTVGTSVVDIAGTTLTTTSAAKAGDIMFYEVHLQVAPAAGSLTGHFDSVLTAPSTAFQAGPAQMDVINLASGVSVPMVFMTTYTLAEDGVHTVKLVGNTASNSITVSRPVARFTLYRA